MSSTEARLEDNFLIGRTARLVLPIFVLLLSTASCFSLRPATTLCSSRPRPTRTCHKSTRGAIEQALILYDSAPDPTDYDDYIMNLFPGALSNRDLVTRAVTILQESKGYQAETTLLATSLCSDELARQLQDDFSHIYGNPFILGGLSGFPFAGNVGFENMALHIPDNGSCLLIYGPHVGVSSTTGEVGIVERNGIQKAESCCASAIAACQFHLRGSDGGNAGGFTDLQQGAVQQLVAPHIGRLQQSENAMQDLPYTLYESQNQLLAEMVQEGYASIKTGLTLLGGIQINTAPQALDYFVPLRFDHFTKNQQGQPVVENMLEQLR